MTPPDDAGARSQGLRTGLARAAGVLLIVAFATLAYAAGLLRPLDDGLAHLRFQLLQRPASDTLTVVEIDAESLAAAGSWPWSRARFARVIDNLTTAGAEVVALDVDFSAPSSEAADEALSAAIRKRPGQVVLPTFVQPLGERAERRQGANEPIAVLAKEAVLGSVNVPVDADGRVRRYRHGFGAAEGDRPSIAGVLSGEPPGSTGAFLIDYGIRHQDIDRLSFEAVHAGRFDPALVRGRKILIGATALELGDEFATPKWGTLTGVYVHALAYESLHAGRALRELQTPFLVLLAALVAFFLRPRYPLELSAALRRHAGVAGVTLAVPLAAQAWAPVSIDAGPVLVAQGLCLIWLVRAELKRRAQAVIEAREAHLVQLAAHMRESRDRIHAANVKLQEANAALDKALKARTEFLATTSHEIRTPLNGILGMTQVILAERNLPDGLRDKVDIVHQSGETMLSLVDDLLDAAKIETGNLVISRAEMDLHRLLDDSIRLWSDKATSKGLSLDAQRREVPALILEDSTRLRQIVSNLMSNAIKFTDAGHISFSAWVEAGEEGETLALEVSDSGIGIPEDKLEVIFEPFRQVDGSTTRKYGGTGLGLAISRQFARAMGGDLTASSTPGQGSKFLLRLPIRRVEMSQGLPEPQQEGVNGLSAATALLVEANPLAQGVLKAALASEVLTLEPAASLDDAFAVLRNRRFDLLLVDGRTLGPEDGAAGALQRLAAEAAGARLVLLWGGAVEDMPALRAAGAGHVLRKPIATTDLVVELKAAFAGTAAAVQTGPPAAAAV